MQTTVFHSWFVEQEDTHFESIISRTGEFKQMAYKSHWSYGKDYRKDCTMILGGAADRYLKSFVNAKVRPEGSSHGLLALSSALAFIFLASSHASIFKPRRPGSVSHE